MHTYICLLRGINVSGHNKIKMSELTSLFESLKFQNIKTYIQSGNVIFQDKNSDKKALEKQIQEKILESFLFKVPVTIKSENELTHVIKNNPFVKDRNEDITKLHVTLLSETPDKTNIDKLKTGEYGVDEFIISDKVIYLFCPNGYGNTKLSNNFFESKLKVTATTRNWKTVNELVKIADTVIEK